MQKDKKYKTALKIQEGITYSSAINDKNLKKIKSLKKRREDPDEIIREILSSNRSVLSQAITLIESSLEKHKPIARKIIEGCLPASGKSVRIGITGVPGVGKSTFIESFGKYLTSNNHKVAVLAIDPSSARSKGSILGDKTRMATLASDENAFIRPSPSGGSLGGVARKTREAVILCEAAGFDIIIIETVGVGQSEIAVHSMTDIFLLLMLPGAGDELQGIKRGIMEMADLIAINKADGNNLEKAEVSRSEYEKALSLFPAPDSARKPEVLLCSAISGKGIARINESIERFIDFSRTNNYFDKKRALQAKYWMHETIIEGLSSNFFGSNDISSILSEIEKKVVDNLISPFDAANLLLEKYFNKIK